MQIPAAARACESWNTSIPHPYCSALPDANWTKLSLSSGELKLNKLERLKTDRWVRQRGADAVVVQIGANEHDDTGYVNVIDVVPGCIKRGWRAVLVEPMPNAYAKLEAKYASLAGTSGGSGRVSLLRAAVCESCINAPSMMYYVDLSNATGNHGSDQSDARCFKLGQFGQFVTEIASLSEWHVISHQRLFKSNPRSCARCTTALGRSSPLPSNCMRSAVVNNVRRIATRCLCLATELAERAITHVDLLMVDAEGYDAQTLRAFPFGAVRVDRIVFEATHMPNVQFRALASHLRSFGFEHVAGSFRAYDSTWHRTASDRYR